MNTNRTQHHLMLCCLLKHYFLRINPWKEKQEVDLVVRFSLCSSAQLLSNVQLSVTPWIVACQAFLSITNFWSLLKLMSIESVMPSNHLILGKRKWQHTPIFLPGESQGQRSPVGCRLWGRTESDMTEAT